MDDKLNSFFSEINKYLPEKDKKTHLDSIISEIKEGLINTNNIIFLCTHNSRRSQLCQIWGYILAKIYKVDLIFNSAGSEKTEVHENIFYCLSYLGIKAENNKVIFKDLIINLHSKTLNEIKEDKFIAIMTCSDAEKSCPNDPRSIKNIKMLYEDPKKFDGTEKEKEEYLKTSNSIAKDLNYIIKNLVHSI